MNKTQSTRRPATAADAVVDATVYIGKGKVPHIVRHVGTTGPTVAIRKVGAKSGHYRLISELTVED
jgi:hypothetical protein